MGIAMYIAHIYTYTYSELLISGAESERASERARERERERERERKNESEVRFTAHYITAAHTRMPELICFVPQQSGRTFGPGILHVCTHAPVSSIPSIRTLNSKAFRVRASSTQQGVGIGT